MAEAGPSRPSGASSPESSAPSVVRVEPGVPRASAILAAVFSVLVPGLGHVYARQTLRGLFWIVGGSVLGIILVLLLRAGANVFVVVLPLAILGAMGLRLGTMLDAVWIVRRHRVPRLGKLKTIVAGLVLVALGEAYSMGLRSFIVESFKMPSASMLPTMLVGDHFMVDKLRSPARGDLLAFPFPEHPNQDFIKRIVGLPGDRITFRDGHPVINDVEVPSCYVGDASYRDDGAPVVEHRGKVYLETLGARRHLSFYDQSLDGSRSFGGPYTVEAGEVFVIGDNRDNSHDSRMWFGGRGGGVPLATNKGVPFVVWLSIAADGSRDWSRFGFDLEKVALPDSMVSLKPGLDRCLGAKDGL